MWCVDTKNYVIIDWPDIQHYMELEGFEDNSSLLTPNDNMGIGSSTYLVDKDWVNSVS